MEQARLRVHDESAKEPAPNFGPSKRPHPSSMICEGKPRLFEGNETRLIHSVASEIEICKHNHHI
jgi:hypothetical protein